MRDRVGELIAAGLDRAAAELAVREALTSDELGDEVDAEPASEDERDR